MLELTQRNIPYILMNTDTYAVGPMDAHQIVEHSCTIKENGCPFTALVPWSLPPTITDQADFWCGIEWGYCVEDDSPEHQMTSPLKLANQLLHILDEILGDDQHNHYDDLYSWAVGYLVGWLSCVAEYDLLLARVGLAHLCFLLCFTPQHCTRQQWFRNSRTVGRHHMNTLRAYRGRLRALTSQGVALQTAYHDAYVFPEPVYS